MTTKSRFGLSFAWLVLYNAAQTFGWSMMGYKMLMYGIEHRTNVGIFSQVEDLLLAFQTAALLEIVHAYTKIVPSNTVLTALQVFSRVGLFWLVMHNVVAVHDSIGVVMAVGAWTLTEIIRYSYYLLGLFENIPYLLLWLRYSLFVFLYPLGVTGELTTIYHSLAPVKAQQIFFINLPNKMNLSFNFYYFLCALFFLYVFYFPKLYFHMFAQRKKNLYPSAKKVE